MRQAYRPEFRASNAQSASCRGNWRVRAAMATALGMISLGLSGCFGGVSIPLAAAASVTSTAVLEDKLPTDYVAEAVTGLDCSYIRHLDDKGPLCRKETRDVIERPLYCYRTLAAIECYEKRDPYGIGQRTVN